MPNWSPTKASPSPKLLLEGGREGIGRRRMRGERKSTAEESVPWWAEEEEAVVVGGEEEPGGKCGKHTLQPPYGVCPACLRDRLLRLCPDCATDRPCGCSTSPSCSASSSSAELPGSGEGGDEGAGVVGAVGPVSRLIESEPAFRRSRSAGFPLLRSRSVAAAAEAAGLPPQRPRGGGKGWASFWPFSRAAAGKKGAAEAGLGLYRSRSVAAGRPSGEEEGGRGKGRRWHFPSPMKVFRHRKSTTKVVQERSPLWRG